MQYYDVALASIETSLTKAPSPPPAHITKKKMQIEGEREVAALERDRLEARATKAERRAIAEAKRKAANANRDFTGLLGPDAILQIADWVMLDNPSSVVKLAGVRRSWREVLLDRPGMWGDVVLGKKRPVQKLKLFGQRSEGRLTRVKIAANLDNNTDSTLAMELVKYADTIETLEIHCHPLHIFGELRNSCRALRRLVLPEINGGLCLQSTALRPDYNLAHRDARLQHLERTGGAFMVGFSSKEGFGPGPHQRTPLPQSLSQLRTVRFSACNILVADDGLPTLFRMMPDVEEVSLHRMYWKVVNDLPDPPGGDRIVMRNLRRYCESETLNYEPRRVRFASITAPQLRHIEFWNVPHIDNVSAQLRTPGLAMALASLQSLSIGRQVVQQDELLAVLRDMPSLKFLNVSYCGLTDSFLEAIARKEPAASQRPSSADSQADLSQPGSNRGTQVTSQVTHDASESQSTQPSQPGVDSSSPILPNLIALSMAGSEITSIPLRDFVYSRLPPKAKPKVPHVSQAASTQRRSAFAPSAPSRSQGVSSGNLQQPSRPTQLDRSPSTQISTSQTPLPSLKWLCIDHCEGVDTQLSVYLKKKLPFISHWVGPSPNEARIRSQGRYSWEAEWYDSCIETEENKCFVRLVPGASSLPINVLLGRLTETGSKDKHEVIHVCRQQNGEPIDDTLNVWATQLTPANSLGSLGGKAAQSDSGWDELHGTPSDQLVKRGWAKIDKDDDKVTPGKERDDGNEMRDKGKGRAKTNSPVPVSSSTSGETSGNSRQRKKIRVNPDGSLGGF